MIRSLLHVSGLRFRVDYPIRLAGRRPIRPDIVFPRHRTAVFVDGCFWHGCPRHGSIPVNNHTYWRDKLKRNVQRDQEQSYALRDAGWEVIRVWEHDDPPVAAQRVRDALSRRY